MNRWIYRISRTASALFITITSSLVLAFILEIIIDIKFDHNVSGIIYMDGFPEWIFGPLMFLTLMFYFIPGRKHTWVKIARSFLVAGLLSYTVVITGLITDIETMGTENMIALGVTLFLCSFAGTLLYEISAGRKEELKEHSSNSRRRKISRTRRKREE